jgi:hypothetical protein
MAKILYIGRDMSL